MANQASSTSRKRPGLGRRTCLYCYHPFRIERGKAPCPHCAVEQSKLEQDLYWTLAPLWKKRQAVVRGLSLFVVAGLALFFMGQSGSDGSSLFWGLGLLVGLGLFLWETAGLLTRRESALPLRFLWPGILLCGALGPFVFSVALHYIGGQADVGLRWRAGGLWAAPWLLPLALSLWIPGWLRRQREACLRSGEKR